MLFESQTRLCFFKENNAGMEEKKNKQTSIPQVLNNDNIMQNINIYIYHQNLLLLLLFFKKNEFKF